MRPPTPPPNGQPPNFAAMLESSLEEKAAYLMELDPATMTSAQQQDYTTMLQLVDEAQQAALGLTGDVPPDQRHDLFPP